jgi:hypothetical protein
VRPNASHFLNPNHPHRNPSEAKQKSSLRDANNRTCPAQLHAHDDDGETSTP